MAANLCDHFYKAETVMITPDLIARRLVGAMKREAAQLVYRVIAPNRYQVKLSPGFLADWRPLLPRLEEELAAHLTEQAQRLKAELLPGGIKVELVPGEELSPKKMEIHAGFERGRGAAASLEAVSGMPRLVFPLVKPYNVVGRGEADIRLPEKCLSVSRRHACLVSAGPGWLVRDLQSAGGTFVNERPVEQAALNSGDLISLGQVVLRFDLAAS